MAFYGPFGIGLDGRDWDAGDGPEQLRRTEMPIVVRVALAGMALNGVHNGVLNSRPRRGALEQCRRAWFGSFRGSVKPEARTHSPTRFDTPLLACFRVGSPELRP